MQYSEGNFPFDLFQREKYCSIELGRADFSKRIAILTVVSHSVIWYLRISKLYFLQTTTPHSSSIYLEEQILVDVYYYYI